MSNAEMISQAVDTMAALLFSIASMMPAPPASQAVESPLPCCAGIYQVSKSDLRSMGMDPADYSKLSAEKQLAAVKALAKARSLAQREGEAAAREYFAGRITRMMQAAEARRNGK